jgi:hypothetical protein
VPSDLLGLYSGDYPAQAGLSLAGVLASLGYSSTAVGDDHWVLASEHYDGQIHLYGQFEMQAFINRAHSKREG